MSGAATRNTDLDMYFHKKRDLPILTKGQTRRLMEQFHGDDPRAAERAKRKLVEHNTFLVVQIAARYFYSRKHMHLTFEDVFQEGTVGLLWALEKFDPSLGYAFSTYATNWIQQRIRRAYDDMDLTIRHPVHTREAIRRYYRYRDELREKLDREPTFEEAWAEVKRRYPKTSDEVKKVLMSEQRFSLTSLEAPTKLAAAEGSSYNSATVADFVEDAEQTEEVMLGATSYGHEVLDDVISTLPSREERLVRLYYGLVTDEDAPRTLDVVGSIEGITRERVRQILDVAKCNMRREFKRRGYEVDFSLPLVKPRANRVVHCENSPPYVDFLHLRWLRKEKGYGMYEFARLVGIKEKRYSAIERGKRVPSYDDLRKIARLLGRPVEEFVSEVEIQEVQEEVAS